MYDNIKIRWEEVDGVIRYTVCEDCPMRDYCIIPYELEGVLPFAETEREFTLLKAVVIGLCGGCPLDRDEYIDEE